MTSEIFVGGRRYVPTAIAAARVGYHINNVNKLARLGRIRRLRMGRSDYICLSDLTSYIRANQARKTKFDLLWLWWKTHHSTREQIRTWRDLARLCGRDGIEISQSIASKFLAKVRQ